MKKIAIFMHNFNGGGAEKVTIKLADELEKRGYNVTFIMRETIGELKNTVPHSINVIDLNINNKSKIIKNLKNITALKKIFNANEFDIMLSITFNMSVLAGIAKFISRSKMKLFAIMHNTISKEKNSLFMLRKLIIKLVNKQIKRFVFVSDGARLDFIQTMKIDDKKTITIYNPVVSDEIEEKCLEKINCDWLDNKDGYKVIVNIGRLTPQKNQQFLLQAIKKVSEEIKVRLIILGEGELRKKLETKADELQISDIVNFYGFAENPYVFLKKADLFVLSSDYEGLPTVLIESLACGCNIVSTDCPTGPYEILDNGKYGKLVQLNNLEEMVENIKYMLKSGGLEENILKERAKVFSIENSVDKYILLMEDKDEEL